MRAVNSASPTPATGPATAAAARPGSARRRLSRGARAALALGVTASAALVTGPASAATGPAGPKPGRSAVDSGPGLSVLQTILIYIGIPLVLFVGIALLSSAGSIRRSGRQYRVADGWDASPMWFNGPAFGGTGQPENRPGPSTLDGGGASARW